MDGFRVRVAVIGRVAATGRAAVIDDVAQCEEFIAAVPGITAEAAVPVFVAGQVVAVVNVETRTSLPTATLDVLGAAGDRLGAWIGEHGGVPAPSVEAQLARFCQEMAELQAQGDIEPRIVTAAVVLSGLSTAALVDRDADGEWFISCSIGPLADLLTAWTPADLACLATWVRAGAPSHLPDGQQPPPGHAFLAAAGIRALAVHPLSRGGAVTGLLLVTDRRRSPMRPETRAVLEQLAASASIVLSGPATRDAGATTDA